MAAPATIPDRGAGSDTYRVGRNLGNDTIVEGNDAGTDRISWRSSIRPT